MSRPYHNPLNQYKPFSFRDYWKRKLASLLTLRCPDLHITQGLHVVWREHARLPVHLARPPLPLFAQYVNYASLVESKLVRVLCSIREHGQDLFLFGCKIEGVENIFSRSNLSLMATHRQEQLFPWCRRTRPLIDTYFHFSATITIRCHHRKNPQSTPQLTKKSCR